MPRARKTLEVEYMRTLLNTRIATCDDVTIREELCILLACLLMHANRYHGFRYIDGWQGTETYRQEYL